MFNEKILLLLGVLFFTANAIAEDKIIPIEDIPVDDPELPGHRHKIPGRPISCTLSTETGVNIPGLETSEIISFDVYDLSGELCLASFSNDMEFVTFLFSLEGDYTLRFMTDGRIYTGYISL